MNGYTSEKLKKYVKYVRDLEVSIYQSKFALMQLKEEMNKICQVTYEETKEEEEEISIIASIFGSALCGALCGAIVGLIINFFRFFISPWVKINFEINSLRTLGAWLWIGIKNGAIIGIPIAIPLGWLGKIDTKKNNMKIRAKNKEIVLSNKQVKDSMIKRKQLLTGEIRVISNHLNKTERMLENVYALNIIHSKYRNMVCICSIYEYLDTGRCFSLEGHEGAYNILEDEIKYRIVCNKLDDIIDNLSSIKEGQAELYRAIDNVNSNVNQLNQSLTHISGTVSSMQEGLASIEYNDKIIAENTSFLKRYTYFIN